MTYNIKNWFHKNYEITNNYDDFIPFLELYNKYFEDTNEMISETIFGRELILMIPDKINKRFINEYNQKTRGMCYLGIKLKKDKQQSSLLLQQIENLKQKISNNKKDIDLLYNQIELKQEDNEIMNNQLLFLIKQYHNIE